MKKNYFLIIGILILLLVGGYFGVLKFINSNQKDVNSIKNENSILKKKSNVNHNVFISNELGFEFSLPQYWVQSNENEVFDSGEIKQLYFKNSLNNTKLTISYYKPPTGGNYFSNLKQQFIENNWIYEKDKKELIISNRKAIQGTQKNIKSSKGIPLEDPNYTVLTSFEGVKKLSSFDIEYKYLKSNESLAKKDLEIILNSFRLK